MLRALGDPLSLLILVVSFVVAVTAHGWVQCLVVDRMGDRRPRSEKRLAPDPRRHIDPFGAIAGAIAGFGWARPVELPPRARKGQVLAVTLSGALLNLLLGVAGLVVVRVLSGPAPGDSTILQNGIGGDLGPKAALLFALMNLYVGVLSLIPLPPLDGGRLLFALGPRSAGWQKAQHYLVEQNIGLISLLVLLLLPLGGPQALLPLILDTLVEPIVRLVTGG